MFNLGTGTPYSVLEIVHAFEEATGVKIKYEFGARRAGDLPEFWANADKAARLLSWKAKARFGGYVQGYLALAE